MEILEDAHEIIKIKQIKESLKYSNAKPSKCKKIYWIYAIRNQGLYPNSSIDSGKFIFFCDHFEIDNIWLQIKKATEEGLLGDVSKCSTKTAIKMRKNQNRSFKQKKKNNLHAICIYTYSDKDIHDKYRIEKQIMLFIKNKSLYYKTNQLTLQNIKLKK